MSKVILVMDKPKTCGLCLLCGRGIRERFCIAKIYKQGNTDNCDISELDKVLKDCPLKPLPQKREYTDDEKENINIENCVSVFAKKGWNDCLDEIIGEEE